MNINWKVRIKNKYFWISIIPILLVLLQDISGIFGFEIDLNELGDRLLNLVKTVFMLLGILGIVNDPTTEGLNDSNQAMKYEFPKTKNGFATMKEYNDYIEKKITESSNEEIGDDGVAE